MGSGVVSMAVMHAIDKVAEYVKKGLTLYVDFLAGIIKKVVGYLLAGM